MKIEEIKIKQKGEEGTVPFEIFCDEDNPCNICNYPMTEWRGRFQCYSCNIFNKHKKRTGGIKYLFGSGIKYFNKNVSIGPYYDKKTITTFPSKNTNLT